MGQASSEYGATSTDNRNTNALQPTTNEGINEKDYVLIEKTWVSINRELVYLGVEIFQEFLSKHPIYCAYFDFIPGTSDGQNYREIPALKQHAVVVMKAINKLVISIKNRDNSLILYLRYIATQHQTRNITEKAYMDLREAFLVTLVNKIGTHVMTKEVVAAYHSALGTVFKMIYDINDTAMTEREIHVVCVAWNTMRFNEIKNTIHMFQMFFQEKPPYVRLFKIFDNMPLDKIYVSPELRTHAVKFIHTLNNLVHYINSETQIKALIGEVAVIHKRKNIPAAAFDDMRKHLIEMMTQQLGTDRVNYEVRKACNKAIKILFTLVIDKMRER